MLRNAINGLLLVATLVVCSLGLELGYRAVSSVPLFRLPDWRNAHIVASDLADASTYDPLLGWSIKAGWRSDGFNVIEYGARRNNPADTKIRSGGVLVVG